jgi:Predicted integral membrane protein
VGVATFPPKRQISLEEITEKRAALRPQSRKSQLGDIARNVIVPFLATRLALLAIGLTTIYYILPLINPSQPIHSNLQTLPFSQMLYSMWAHFDSGFFTGIARRGYQTGPNALAGMSNWAFFPLYPIAIRLLIQPFSITGNHAVIAGIIVSNISSLVACIYLYKLATKEFNSVVAQRAVLYMLIYPMSFYLSSVYSEGIFMALSIGCVYHARQRHWLLSGILGCLAALTRPQGAFLAIAVAWEYWQYIADRFAPRCPQQSFITTIKDFLRSRIVGLYHSLSSMRTWLGFACIALTPLGLALFCCYSKWKVNSFKAFLMVEENGWGRHASNPIILVWYHLQHPIHATPYTWEFYIYNMIIIFLCWTLFLVVLRRMPFMYVIITFVYLYMPLAAGSIGSVGRLYLISFPLYIVAAYWSTKGNEARHNAIMVVSAMLLGIGMMMFVIGVYAMA